MPGTLLKLTLIWKKLMKNWNQCGMIRSGHNLVHRALGALAVHFYAPLAIALMSLMTGLMNVMVPGFASGIHASFQYLLNMVPVQIRATLNWHVHDSEYFINSTTILQTMA